MTRLRLYQRAYSGYAVRDGYENREYPLIPEATRFQCDYGYEVPTAVHGWQWSTTFNRWTAYCTFSSGWTGFTFPAIEVRS